MSKEIFSYKQDSLQTIEKINQIKTFFFVTELPLNFTENLSVDQIVRFANFVN